MSLVTSQTRSTPDVWALAYVSQASEQELHNFFIKQGLRRAVLKSNLHVTIYYARRVVPGLSNREERIDIQIDPANLRFMVLTPGGENPRPDADPSVNQIGVRIRRTAPERLEIENLRARFYDYESLQVLGARRPSDRRRNAFGARHFQPHITLLKSGADIDPDLTKLGERFRVSVGAIQLDRLVIKSRGRPTGR